MLEMLRMILTESSIRTIIGEDTAQEVKIED